MYVYMYIFLVTGHVGFGNRSTQHPLQETSPCEIGKYKIPGYFWGPFFGYWIPFLTLGPGSNYSLYLPLKGSVLLYHQYSVDKRTSF